MIKLNKKRRIGFILIITLLIISMIGVVAYGILPSEPTFDITTNENSFDIEHGGNAKVDYTISPKAFNPKNKVEKQVVLVIDTSQTMVISDRNANVIQASSKFINRLVTNNKGNCRVGVIAYNGEAEIVSRLSNNTTYLNNKVNSIDDNWKVDNEHLGTNAGDALRLALSLFDDSNVNKQVEKTLIFMTNGKPNAYTGYFYPNTRSISLSYNANIIYSLINTMGMNAYDLNEQELKNYESYFYKNIDQNKFGESWFEKNDINALMSLLNQRYGFSMDIKPDAIEALNAVKYNNRFSGGHFNLENRYGVSNYLNFDLGYAYSLSMASKLKENKVSTYSIYFGSESDRNRYNTVEKMSEYAGNAPGDNIIQYKKTSNNTDNLNDIFSELESKLDNSYTTNNMILKLNIPEGVNIDSITYNGETIKVDKSEIKDGKYSFDLNKIKYTLNSNGEYISNPFNIQVEYKGNNLSSEDIKSYNIDGELSIDGKSVGNIPNIYLNVKRGISVTIGVKDARGEVGVKYNSADLQSSINNTYNDINQDNTLIGNGYANINIEGVQKKEGVKYSVETWFEKKGDSEKINFKTWDLNNINPDIEIDKPNELRYRSYDVTHLPPKQNESAWNNKENVFKNASSSVKGYLSTSKIANIPYNSSNQIVGGRIPYGHPVIHSGGYGWQPNYVFYDSMVVDSDWQIQQKYPGFEYKEADKYWGYIKPKETGWYQLGTFSDDGSKGVITINGNEVEFTKNSYGLVIDRNEYKIAYNQPSFTVHGPGYYSSFESVYLENDKYYPIYLEYFNWGGGGCFKLGYTYWGNNKDSERNSKAFNSSYVYNAISKNGWWDTNEYDYLQEIMGGIKYVGNDNNNFLMYPSKSNEPGESADGIFKGGKDGIPFPTEEGTYIFHYRVISSDNKDSLKQGAYGNFTVENRFIASIDLNNGNEVYANNNYDLTYRLEPKDISTKDIVNNQNSLPQYIKLKNVKINGVLPNGMEFITKPGSNLNENYVNGYKIEKSGSATTIGTNLTITFNNDIIYELSADKKSYICTKNIFSIPIKIRLNKNGEYILKSEENKVTYNYDEENASKITQYFPNININANEPSKIIKFGILDGQSIKEDSGQGFDVVGGADNNIPTKVGMTVFIGATNSVIDVSLDSIKLNNNNNVTVTKYKLNENGEIAFDGNKEVRDFKVNNNAIKIDNNSNFSFEKNTNYIFVINIVPNIQNGDTLNLRAFVEGNSDVSKKLKLNSVEMPDVF